jgi:putative integral membrane protein (TIGR02587 family)
MASAQATQAGQESEEQSTNNSGMWIDLGRAFAGALIFSISLLMTMETWWLGFYMNRWRLLLFVLVNMALLIGLAYYRGFRKDFGLRSAIIDAFVGYAVGVTTGAVFLTLFGVIEWGMPADEIVGKVALQSISSSIGALLARSQLGGDSKEPEEDQGKSQQYWAELFLMVIGALFVGYTVAPTEEIPLITYQMTAWHGIAAVLISLFIMHAFVYQVEFRGQESMPEDRTQWAVFLHFTVVGYLLVFLTSLYILWTFGRMDGAAWTIFLHHGVVLSVPGALGAAAARLIL